MPLLLAHALSPLAPLCAPWWVCFGFAIGFLVARYQYRCTRLGHDWERYEIEGSHYRSPANETFRVCHRCGHVEIGEEAL